MRRVPLLTLLPLVALLSSLLLAGPVAHAEAAGPTASVAGEPVVVPGSQIVMVGNGWPGRSLVHIELCGNGGLTTSSGCALDSAIETGTTPDGRLTATLVVTIPPVPCPCVLRLASEAVASPVVVPIEIVGTQTSAITTPALPEPSLGVRAQMLSAPWWRAAAGFSTRRTVAVEVTNLGELALDDVLVSARVGQSRRPTGFVAPRRIKRLQAGDTRTVRLVVDVPALPHGTYRVVGRVEVAGAEAPFAVRTTAWAWIPLLVPILLAQLVLLGLRDRARRRLLRLESSVGTAEKRAHAADVEVEVEVGALRP